MKETSKFVIYRLKQKIDNGGTYLLFVLLAIVGVYIIIHSMLGGSLFYHNSWDSYTLQSVSWLNGRTHLGRNYKYLELAVYEGKYYVSFPPFPSVVMLPFAVLYGTRTPNNILMILFVLITITFAYLIARHFKMGQHGAAFYAVFLVFGSNMFWMSTMGGVWFIAQLLGMMFALMSIYSCLKGKRSPAYLLLAFAVGCRPFYIVYYPVIMLWMFLGDKKHGYSMLRSIVKQIPGIVSAALVGGCYMIYNYVRFKNPFEFGHNYLPEFTESTYGQFSSVYFKANIRNILLRMPRINSQGEIKFPIFDGFAFYIANPIFIILFMYMLVALFRKLSAILKGIKNRKVWNAIYTRNTVIMPLMLLMFMFNTIALCVHKTFGGWQFGCRYMCDLIAFAYLFIFLAKKDKTKLSGVEVAIGIFGIALNAYGIVYMNFIA